MMNFHKISSKFTFTRRSSRLSWRSICPSEVSPESSHEQFSIHNRHTIAKSHPSHRITLWSHPSCLGTSSMTARSPTNATPFRWGIDFNTFNNPSYTRFQSNDPSIDSFRFLDLLPVAIVRKSASSMSQALSTWRPSVLILWGILDMIALYGLPHGSRSSVA